MALLRDKSGTDIRDLIILEKNEAMTQQMKIVSAWEPQSQVWSLNHAGAVLSGCTAASSVYINNHYRIKLRLQKYGRLTTTLPIVVIPAIASVFIHTFAVQNDILVRETKCSLCIELRSAAIQMGTSVAFPLVMAPLGAFALAEKYRTFVTPDLTKAAGRRYALQTFQKFTKPIASKLLLIAAAQGLVGSLLAYQQMKTIAMIDAKFLELEVEENSEF